ncbi:SEM5A protein, partial [Polypterus senegalus]
MRFRICTHPESGMRCLGPTADLKPCPNLRECPVDGGWSPWSAWRPCPVTCGLAVVSRSRICNSPSARNGGKTCQGQEYEEATCGTPAIVADLRGAAEKPMNKLNEYLRRLSREPPVLIDLAVQVGKAGTVYNEIGTQSDMGPRLIHSGCQVDACPTREAGTITEWPAEGLIDPGQLHSADSRSETALKMPPPVIIKVKGVQTVKGLSSSSRETQTVDKPQIKQEIPKIKRGSPDKEREKAPLEAAGVSLPAKQGADLTFPNCFQSRRGRIPGGRRQCYGCRRLGHIWRYCPWREGTRYQTGIIFPLGSPGTKIFRLIKAQPECPLGGRLPSRGRRSNLYNSSLGNTVRYGRPCTPANTPKPPGGALLAAWRSPEDQQGIMDHVVLCTALLDAMGPREELQGGRRVLHAL